MSSSTPPRQLPVWLREGSKVNLYKPTDSLSMRLAQEISIYEDYVDTVVAPIRTRLHQALEKLNDAVTSIIPQARVIHYGSISTGLWLPDSDVDVVVFLPPPPDLEESVAAGEQQTSMVDRAKHRGIFVQRLKEVEAALEAATWVDSVRHIYTARIPILKLRVPSDGDSQSQPPFQIDVTMGFALEGHDPRLCHNGLQAAGLVSDFLGKQKTSETSEIIETDKLSESAESASIESAEPTSNESAEPTSNETVEASNEDDKASNEKVEAKYVQKANKTITVNELPLLRPLVLIIKALLRGRGLNESVSGGLSSYSITMLVISFLQMASSAVSQNMTNFNSDTINNKSTGDNKVDLLPVVDLVKNGAVAAATISTDRVRTWSAESAGVGQPLTRDSLGVLLLRFLEYYGTAFNLRNTGISVEKGGYHFVRNSPGFGVATGSAGSSGFLIEDPFAPGENLAASSYASPRITAAFEDIFFALKNFRTSRLTPTALCLLIHPEGYTKYHQR